MGERGEAEFTPELPLERLAGDIREVARLLEALDLSLTDEFDPDGLIEYIREEGMDEADARMAVYQAVHELWAAHGHPDVLDPDTLMAEAGIIEPEV